MGKPRAARRLAHSSQLIITIIIAMKDENSAWNMVLVQVRGVAVNDHIHLTDPRHPSSFRLLFCVSSP